MCRNIVFVSILDATTSVEASDSGKERDSLSTGVAVAITLTITLVVSLPVGVVIGVCLPQSVRRCGGGERRRNGRRKEQQLQAAIYEEPAPPVETAITLSENQAYGQVSSQR